MASLALGTVQFGLNYGIANQTGQVSTTEATAILGWAARHRIDTLDTAVAYGDCERRLGEIGVGQWHVISKLPPLPDSCTDAEGWVRESVACSLERLRIRRLRAMLLHRSRDLLGPHGAALYRGLLAVRTEGKVEKIGISIYDPEELDTVWPRFQLDMIQAPFNIIDRRLASSGWLARLHHAQCEVHIRSIFLQGLLLMSTAQRLARFGRWQPLWSEWQRWLDETMTTPLQACLRFALGQPLVSRVVVGVDGQAQLQEILASATANGGASAASPPDTLASSDPDLINPSRWTSA